MHDHPAIASHDSTPRPRPADRGRRAGVLTLVLAALLALGGVAVADHGDLMLSVTDRQELRSFADGEPAGGHSFLTRTHTMLLATVEAEDLEPGNAYTLWWAVFNHPENCSDPCDGSDVFRGGDPERGLDEDSIREVGFALGHASGNLARGDGTLEFGARLVPNDEDGHGHQIVIPAGFEGPGLLTVDTHEAEIHVAIQEHGEALTGEELLEQLSIFEGGCNPECEDILFAIHLP